jgi:trehalose-6-phosphate synthase
MADSKITALPVSTAASADDLMLIVDAPGGTPETQAITNANWIASFAASTTDINIGSTDSYILTPREFTQSSYGKRTVELQLCRSDAMTSDSVAYFRTPSFMDGWNLVTAAAGCVTNTSTDNLTLGVYNGATMMLTNVITIEPTETDSKDATTAPSIDTANDAVATGNMIKAAPISIGTGAVTYMIVEATFQKP